VVGRVAVNMDDDVRLPLKSGRRQRSRRTTGYDPKQAFTLLRQVGSNADKANLPTPIAFSRQADPEGYQA
jgi:hypothetical protein